jgi:DNA primase
LALPAGFLDELRARTPLATVIGRRVRLVRSGRNWKGCCPFHNEKTPSFYVYDNGFHCFGCGANGDAISFVMQSQGIGFMEAVEALAGEAGMEVPKPTPEAAAAERQRLDLVAVLEAATAAYQRRLRLPEGATALAYLRRRGLTDETIERFALGWSGAGRGALAADLARQGVEVPMLVEAGLMRPGEEGRAPYDLFFNRVIFPIRDRRGRTISFGGRTLGDGQPKYVNGPETPLFSKRRTLFGLDRARDGARTGAAVVAVEGYMDVIALHQAGFTGAVAPLGTALTEEQLAELWQLSPMPALCFDGDAAGARAAARAAELALPHLTAECSLKLATLPAGEDPDTLVLRQGPAAFQAVLDAARPLGVALFDLVRDAAGLSGVARPGPEQRAALRARLEDLAGRIRDRTLAAEYRRALLDRFYERPAGAQRGAAGRPSARLPRAAPRAEAAWAERGRVLVAVLLRYPALLHDVEEAFATVELTEAMARLRDAILHWGVEVEALDSAALMSHLLDAGLTTEVAQAVAATPVPLPACAEAGAMPAEAEAGWWHFFGLIDPHRLDQEVAAAQHDLAERTDEATQRRLIALCAAREALRRGDADGSDADEAGRSAGGEPGGGRAATPT